MARRKRLPNHLRRTVFVRDDYTCRYCGHRPTHLRVWNGYRWQAMLHVDHVIPVVAGGMDTITNLVTACASCNLEKGARVIEENVDYVRRLERRQADLEAARMAATIDELLYEERDWDLDCLDLDLVNL